MKSVAVEVAAQIGEAAAFKQTDVSDAEQVQALVDFAVDQFGGLDIMFNNAGIGSPLKRFLPDDLEDFTRIMNVNLFGVIIGAQRAGRYMKDHGGGCIINNASIAAINAGTGMISYRSAKAAVAHATKCMAIDLAPYGIRVNCLTPPTSARASRPTRWAPFSATCSRWSGWRSLRTWPTRWSSSPAIAPLRSPAS